MSRDGPGSAAWGNPRVVAVVELHGGYVAREAKALAPSACIWAAGGEGRAIHYATIVRRAVRDADPFLQVRGDWVVRRLAPDCSRIVATTVQTVREQEELARAMGVETANIHLGAARSRIDEVRRDLAARPEGWLRSASKAMARATQRDFDAWRRRMRTATPQAAATAGRSR